MNLHQLEYFVAVADSQSFTKAAARLFVTQTAITQQVRVLEETLGVELFNRNMRPITLTPAGCLFLNEAKAILERMNQAVYRVREVSVNMMGTLNIGYIKGYERSSFSDRLRAFHQNYPNILLSCFRNNTDHLADGLMQGAYDLIFTWSTDKILTNPSVSYIRIESYPLNAVVYDSHPLARKKSLKRMDLKNEKFLYGTFSENGDAAGDNFYMELYDKAGFQPNIIYKTNDLENILIMIAAEEGISILPSYMKDGLINMDCLKFIPLQGAAEQISLVIAWKNENVNPFVEQFIEVYKKGKEK